MRGSLSPVVPFAFKNNVYEEESIVDKADPAVSWEEACTPVVPIAFKTNVSEEESIVGGADPAVSWEEACTPVVPIAFTASSVGGDGGPLRFDFPPPPPPPPNSPFFCAK